MTLLLLIVLGLCFGSFINALVWRLHEGRDWVKERSVCTYCNHELAAIDLVPVLSWVWLRGRCRYCSKQISWQYPVVELLGMVGFLVSYIYWPSDLTGATETLLPFIVWLISYVGLLAITVYDLRWFIIPDKITYPLIVLAVTHVFAMAVLLGNGTDVVKDAVIGLLIGGGLFYALYQVSGGRWLGGGDVKLGIFQGLLLGARDTFIALYAAALSGLVVMVVLMSIGRLSRKSKMPFGPFLVLGTIIARLFGQSLWVWYHKLLLP